MGSMSSTQNEVSAIDCRLVRSYEDGSPYFLSMPGRDIFFDGRLDRGSLLCEICLETRGKPFTVDDETFRVKASKSTGVLFLYQLSEDGGWYSVPPSFISQAIRLGS